MASQLNVDTIAPESASEVTLNELASNSVNITGGSITGITDLVVADGGTGVSTLADGGLVIGNAAAAVEVVAAGATTEILVGGGASTAPVWTTATGSGAPVRATSPTLVTPLLGTPTSGTLTNCTGTAAGLTAGNVTTNANLTGHVTSVGNAAVLGSFTLAQLNTAISDANVGITVAAEQASTSGTAITFTGIPAGVKEITVMFEGVSFSSAASLVVQLGDAGGLENTTYDGDVAQVVTTPSVAIANTTVGFSCSAQGAAATLIHTGILKLQLKDAANFTWVGFGLSQRDDANTSFQMFTGVKSLSAELTQVSVTSATETAVFDAGSISISYQ